MRSLKCIAEVVLAVAVTAVTSIAVPTEEAIVDRFIEMYDLDTLTHEVELVSCGLKTATVLPEHIVIRATTRKEPLGMFSAIVKIEENGDEIESAPVRFEIRRYTEVVVANENLGRFDEDLSERCVLRRMETTRLRERPITDIAELRGLRAKRNLTRGSIITAASVETIPDVESGREVSITFVDGPVQITAVGKALQTGSAGEYIKVKNKSSGKIIMARIVEDGLVAIDP